MTDDHLDATGVTLPDTSRLTEALTEVGRRIGESMRRFTAQINAAAWPKWDYLRANDPVRLAGLEGRYGVRAGLDPAYRTPEGLTDLVGQIMRGDGDEWTPGALRHVTVENRAQIAACAIRGWSTSYGHGPAHVAWTRLLGSTRIKVRCG